MINRAYAAEQARDIALARISELEARISELEAGRHCCGTALQAALAASEPKTRSQKLHDAGITRRPSAKSLPSDGDDTPIADDLVVGQRSNEGNEMTTIPQRLREIAKGLAEAAAARRGLGLDKAAELYSMASELEAPAADAARIAGLEADLAERDARIASIRKEWGAEVAGLTARISGLEGRQLPAGSLLITDEKLAEMIRELVMAGARAAVNQALKSGAITTTEFAQAIGRAV